MKIWKNKNTCVQDVIIEWMEWKDYMIDKMDDKPLDNDDDDDDD